MVNLDNPYSLRRPPVTILLTIPLLFLAGYYCFHLAVFSFIYQYSLMVLLMILASFPFDRDVLSARRLFTVDFYKVKRYFFLSPLAIFAAFYLAGRFIYHKPVLSGVYRAGATVSGTELLLLLLLIIAPFEEIFFRGFLQFNMMSLFGKKGGYIIASLVYAGLFIFTGSVPVMLFFLVMGLYLGLIFLKYNSCFLTILTHQLMLLLMFIFPF